MVGWHHRLNGLEFEQTQGDSEGQRSPVCCSPWGCKELDTTQRLNNNSFYRVLLFYLFVTLIFGCTGLVAFSSCGEWGLPSPVTWPGEFHGLYGPWGCKELDMTE